MADDAQKPRMMTEDEAYAIAADRTLRETAELKAKAEDLTTQNAELQSKLDIAQAGVATEKAARDKAEQDLVAFKEQVTKDQEIAARTEVRVSKVREVAKNLGDDFYTPERAKRWAEMDDGAFDGYVAEIAAVSGTTGTGTNGTGTTTTTAGPPRETAMAGAPAGGSQTNSGAAERMFAARRGGGI